MIPVTAGIPRLSELGFRNEPELVLGIALTISRVTDLTRFPKGQSLASIVVVMQIGLPHD